MREILFRGIRKDTHEWVYGFYGEYFNGKENIPCISIVDTHAIAGSFCYEVIPETVGQFTGLTDKNGNRIFEGDIIAGKIGKFVIRWSEPICGFAAGEGLKMVPCMNQGTMKYCEVVGNIYDNPELLEVSDNG